MRNLSRGQVTARWRSHCRARAERTSSFVQAVPCKDKKTAVPQDRRQNGSRGRTRVWEREQKQRESERRKEEAAAVKERDRREKAVAKAQAAIEKATAEHEKRASTIETERAALEKRLRAEDARWEKQKKKVEMAARRARGIAD